MPTHPVINRRNLNSPLVRKSMMASQQGIDAAAEVAKRLHVSQGSVIDTALLVFARLDLSDIVNELRATGHLTDAEHGAVLKVAGLEEKGK